MLCRKAGEWKMRAKFRINSYEASSCSSLTAFRIVRFKCSLN